MAIDNKPIIFIHYGVQDYMSYTLKAARLSNPNKRIILLGDESNIKIAHEYGVEHVLLEKYRQSDTIKEFEKVFQFIAGENHMNGEGFFKERGADYWTKFNFIKWFSLYNSNRSRI